MLSIEIGADSKRPIPVNKSDKVLATLASYGCLMIIATISLTTDLGGICFNVLAFTRGLAFAEALTAAGMGN